MVVFNESSIIEPAAFPAAAIPVASAASTAAPANPSSFYPVPNVSKILDIGDENERQDSQSSTSSKPASSSPRSLSHTAASRMLHPTRLLTEEAYEHYRLRDEIGDDYSKKTFHKSSATPAPPEMAAAAPPEMAAAAPPEMAAAAPPEMAAAAPPEMAAAAPPEMAAAATIANESSNIISGQGKNGSSSSNIKIIMWIVVGLIGLILVFLIISCLVPSFLNEIDPQSFVNVSDDGVPAGVQTASSSGTGTPSASVSSS